MTLEKGDRLLLWLLALVLGSFAVYSIATSTPNYPHDEPNVAVDSVQMGANSDSLTRDVDTSYVARPIPQNSITPKKGGLLTTSRYPGPPKWQKGGSNYQSKLKQGETLDLNVADTLQLQKVPGIGSSFARRICKYRELLGGYYVREQLQEVYGMDRERYDKIAPFFVIRKPIRKVYLSIDSISSHPYLSYRQRDVLTHLLQKGDSLTWPVLMKSGTFTQDDSLRLAPYLPIPYE